MKIEYDLLNDPILSIRVDGGPVTKVTLPKVLEHLSHERDVSFLRERWHHRLSNHITFALLGMVILERSGQQNVAQNESFWRKGCDQLANGERSAWALYCDDPTKPAYGQPPMRAKIKNQEDEETGKKIVTPDGLDVITTSNGHGTQDKLMSNPEPEDWFYAINSMQNQIGMASYRYPASSRGRSSRIRIECTNDMTTGGQFAHSVRVGLREDVFEHLLATYGYREKGTVLTWLPDISEREIPASELHPYFLDFARWVRIHKEADRLYAWMQVTEPVRLEVRSATGDPWAPTEVTNIQSKEATPPLTMSVTERNKDGFTYRFISEAVFGTPFQAEKAKKKSFAINPMVDKGIDASKPCYLLLQGIIRDSKKSGVSFGYHERVVQIGGPWPGIISSNEDMIREHVLGQIVAVRNGRQVLEETLLKMFRSAGNPQTRRLEMRNWFADALRTFEETIDEHFFEALFKRDPTSTDFRAWTNFVFETVVKSANKAASRGVKQASAQVNANNTLLQGGLKILGLENIEENLLPITH